jgi:hypothetical protein
MKRFACRRGRGEGSIFQVNGRDLWRAQFRPTPGAKRVVIYAPTKDEVLAKLSELKDQARKGVNVNSRATLGAWIASFIAARVKWSPAYRRRRDEVLRLHIEPRIGSLRSGR